MRAQIQDILGQDDKVNQAKLAELAGVSRATVSRALAHNPRIGDEVASRIRALARQLNYRPNAAARSVVTRRSQIIGIVLCDRTLTGPPYAAMAAGVESSARELGLKLQISLCDSASLDNKQLPPIFQDDGVDGIILAGAPPDWLLERLSRWRLPAVLLGTRAALGGVNQVGGDANQGGRLAAEYLLGLGHRRIGLVVGPRSRAIHRDYFDGFVAAAQEVGISADEVERLTVECYDLDPIGPVQTLLKRQQGDGTVTAIFADTDTVAWQTIQYLRAIDRPVPESISVVGAGLIYSTPSIPYTITTVDVQLSEMGRTAVHLLREVIEHPGGAARRIVVEPRLALGQTTAPPRAAASEISQ